MKNIILLLLPAISLLGCRNEIEFNPAANANVTFAGYVSTDFLGAVSDATIHVNGQDYACGLYGEFRLPQMTLSSVDARVQVTRAGCFDFTRSYIVSDGSVQNIDIHLISKNQSAVFDAAQGLSWFSPNIGIDIKIPANSIVSSTGVSYTGPVVLFAKQLDPDAPDFYKQMPGDLRCINASGAQQIMLAYGMLLLDMRTPAGEKLDIAPGSSAELVITAASSKGDITPLEIPLWYFDADQSRWIEEGSGKLIGNQYFGSVKHISYWSCGESLSSVYVKGKIFMDASQHPYGGADIQFSKFSKDFVSYVKTDLQGAFGACIPKDEAMHVTVFSQSACSLEAQTLYSQTIGPFSNDEFLQPVVVDITSNPSLVQVQGVLQNCQGIVLQDGYVIFVDILGRVPFVPTDENGRFSMVYQPCLPGDPILQIAGFSVGAVEQSQPGYFTAQNSVVDAGVIPVCLDQAENIKYILDGQLFIIQPYGLDSLVRSGSIIESTLISGYKEYGGGGQNIEIGVNNNQQTGSYPVSLLRVNGLEADLQNASNFQITLSSAAAVGNYLTGSFAGIFYDLNSNAHTLTGTFRVKRDY